MRRSPFAIVALLFVFDCSIASSLEIDDVYIGGSVSTLETQDKEGFKPRNDLPGWPLEFPINWSADPFEDVNWRYQLNAWRMMDPLIVAYFREGDADYLHRAVGYMRDWYRFHIEEEETAEHSWHDMATGIRALRLALILDRYRSSELELSSNAYSEISLLAREHARRLQEDGFISDSNHGIFQIFGLNLLCKVADDLKECVGATEYAEEELDSAIRRQFTDEGMHKEHSPAYHFFGYRNFKELGSLRHFESRKAREILMTAERLAPWLVFPNGEIARIGDTMSSSEPLSGPVDDPVCFETDCYAVGDFTRSGYAIIRDIPKHDDPGQSMLFVTGMAYSKIHKHADDLSFELYEGGQFIFADTGKYGYTRRDPMRRHIKNADAHNTVSVVGARVRWPQFDGSLLEPVEKTSEAFVIKGKVVRPDLFEQTRNIVYRPGKSLRIEDSLASDDQHIYISSLHLAPDIDAELTEEGFVVPLSGWEIRATLENDDCEIERVRGQDDPILGWTTAGFLEMTPATVVRALCSGDARQIVWDIDLGHATAQ